jgi:transposase
MEQECPGCRERDARLAVLEAKVAELEARLHDLTKPPVAPRPAPDLPKGPAKQPTGKKPGGQPGHPPHLKQLVPPERVNETVPFIPVACAHCQTALPQEAGPNDPPPLRHQVAELPKLAAHITEYQGHARTCPCCGKVTQAAIPEEFRAYSVGPNLTGVLSYFAGCHGVSKRGVEEIAEAVFDANVALGTVANLEQEVSAALAPAYQEAKETAQQAPVKHLDETGWKEAGKKRWLWVAATTTVVVFMIHTLRNIVALRQLLGTKLRGILCSDRWVVYDNWPTLRRQVCWAHLKRNWEKMLERGGAAKRIAQACLSVQKQVFELWHLFRGGGCSRKELGNRMAPLTLDLLAVLQSARRCRDRKTRRFCARLENQFLALWTFVVVKGVEPTNNHAERVQRRAVLWRRRSFGCHSANGCRFVERILTVVQTLRLQKRSVVQFLQEAIAAHRSGQKSPKGWSLAAAPVTQLFGPLV